MTIRTLAAALLLAASAAPAAAQDLRPVRAADTVGMAAPNLYQLIERLRPEWLRMAGDPADPAARERVRVFRNGMFAGALDALRQMPVEGLVQVRLAGPRAAVARDPRTPPDAAAAILVTYAGEHGGRRMEFVVSMGARGDAIQERAAESLVVEGWLPDARDHQTWIGPERKPVAVSAAASLYLRPDAGVTLAAHRTGKFNARGISANNPPQPPLPQTTWFGTTDVAATVFTQQHFVRAGVGPALRVVDYRRTTGYCECREGESGMAAAVGAAGDLGIVFPPVGPAVMQLQASVRWFPSHGIPAGEGMPRVELGGVTMYFTVGAGLGR